MKTAVFTGSFDPFTEGHKDIARRAANMFDKLYICVLINPDKTPKYSLSERVLIIKEALSNIDNIEVSSYNGLAVDYVKSVGADYIVRGLRNPKDYAYERLMSEYNLNLGITTLYLVADRAYKNISSTAEKLKDI